MESISEITSNALQGNMLERLSGQIRENPSAIKRGLEQAIPASMAGLGSYASTERNAEELLGTIRGGRYQQMSASDVVAMGDEPGATARIAQSGSGVLDRIFGDRQGAVVDAIAKQSGLTRPGASRVLAMAAPLVLAAVGREAQTRRMDARGLSSFLGDQRRSLSGSLGGPLAGAIGTERIGGTTTERISEKVGGVSERVSEKLHRARDVAAEHMPETHRPKGFGWKLAALAAAAIAALFLFSRRSRPEIPNVPTPELPKAAAPNVEPPKVQAPEQPSVPHQAAPEATPQPEQQAQAPEQQAQAPVEQQAQAPEEQQAQAPEEQQAQAPEEQAAPTEPSPEQPAGVAAEVMSLTTGATALGTLLDGDATLPQRFSLDGVEFQSGSAEVAAANPLLNSVAGVLQAHPDASIRLDGYADTTGDPETNATLSEARAQSVKDYLIAQGANGSSIETQGNATERPVASNDTAQGKAENRRVELVVTER